MGIHRLWPMFWEISSDFARLSLISIDVDSLDKTLEMSIEFGRCLKILIEIDKLLEICTVEIDELLEVSIDFDKLLEAIDVDNNLEVSLYRFWRKSIESKYLKI